MPQNWEIKAVYMTSPDKCTHTQTPLDSMNFFPIELMIGRVIDAPSLRTGADHLDACATHATLCSSIGPHAYAILSTVFSPNKKTP